MTSFFGGRFQDSTRGRIVARLRVRSATVEELAAESGLTPNAIRPHLVALERDGIVLQTGVRRSDHPGKPAMLFALNPDAEPALSRAYAPVLAAVLEVLAEELPPAKAARLLRNAGRRLAAKTGHVREGDLAARGQAAADVLIALGGTVEVAVRSRVLTLRGEACPLETAVRRSPHACLTIEALLSAVSGAKVTRRCQYSDRPRCCFELRGLAADAARPASARTRR